MKDFPIEIMDLSLGWIGYMDEPLVSFLGSEEIWKGWKITRQVDTCMDLPDTDKNNKETEKTIDCICKMIQNKKNWPKKSFFWKNKISIISTHYSTKNTKNKEKLMNRFFTQSKKPYFWAFLGPNWPEKIFYRKKIFFHN